MMPIVLLLVAPLLLGCNCDPPPTIPLFFSGTVLPKGNYHIYVRTIPAAEVMTILESYDEKIKATEKEIKVKNAAWMKFQIIPGLKKERFQAENTFGVLGDAIVTQNDEKEDTKGTKFSLKLDMQRAHDPYFNRHFDPIYVQIYVIDGPFQKSLIERILIDPSDLTEYEFIFGTPREQQKYQQQQQLTDQVPKKYLLGQMPISNVIQSDDGEILGNFAVKIHQPISGQIHQIGTTVDQMVKIDADGNFAVEFPNQFETSEKIFLTFVKSENERNKTKTLLRSKVFLLEDPLVSLNLGSELKVKFDFLSGKLETGVTGEWKGKVENTWKIEGLIQNLFEKERHTVTKVEVKLFSERPVSLSNSARPLPPRQTVEAQKSPICKGCFTFQFDGVQTSELSSNEVKKAALHGLRTKSERRTGAIYFVVEATENPHYKMTYPTLTTQMEQNNGEDVSLYRYKFAKRQTNGTESDPPQIPTEPEKAKMIELYRAYLIRNKTDPEKIFSQMEAFEMSLQMVRMKETEETQNSDSDK